MRNVQWQSDLDECRSVNYEVWFLPSDNKCPLTVCCTLSVSFSGTIKRGQKVGETVEVQLQLTEKEMNKLHQSTNALDEEDKDRDDACIWGLDKGLHIIVLTILFIPFAFIMSMGMAAYIGTIAWYNVYLNLSEERTVWHKVFLCPLLILTFPVFIVLTAVCIGLYAAVIQVSATISDTVN